MDYLNTENATSEFTVVTTVLFRNLAPDEYIFKEPLNPSHYTMNKRI